MIHIYFPLEKVGRGLFFLDTRFEICDTGYEIGDTDTGCSILDAG
jgi:hypothetical protein